jgi:hypothetical protein
VNVFVVTLDDIEPEPVPLSVWTEPEMAERAIQRYMRTRFHKLRAHYLITPLLLNEDDAP